MALLFSPETEMSNSVIVKKSGQAIIVRFDRPEVRNPLSVAVLTELSRIVTEIESDRDVRVVIFTGVGKVFASGADLREIAGVDADGAAEFANRGQELMRKIADLRAETIAAVNGICFGGALDLAVACTRRLASPEAEFSHPGANLGIITGWGGTQRLPQLIGQAKALEMFFTAKRMNAGEALSCGLVDVIADDAVAVALRSANGD
jgi:enoyl-CoA hydratase/carnithine racemase